MEKIKAEMREEEKEEWKKTSKDGIFREIPPQELENIEPDFEEEIDDIDFHKNNTVIDIFDDFDDDELDEIANEYSLSNSPKSKLKNKKSDDESKNKKKEKKEEQLDKGQTTLFSF